MKYLLSLITLVLCVVISSCSGSGGWRETNADTVSTEESERIVDVPRSIEGITLGMSEQELINVINPQSWPKDFGFYEISDWDREHDEILSYRRSIPSDDNQVIVEEVKCYKGKVFEIALQIPYGTFDEVLEKFKEKYPLEEIEISNILFSSNWWEYSDGKTKIKLTRQYDMSINSSGSDCVVYTDEAYIKLREQEEKEEEAANSSQIDKSIKNL